MHPKDFTPEFPALHPKIVLGIAAHPDDLDVGAGGTMAKFASEGADVHYLILTDGGKGSDDPTMTTEQLVALRHKEQTDALKSFGGKTITFLDYPDGELEITMQLKKQIAQHIRTIKPDVVVTMDPTVVYSAANGIINHPDHRAAGQAALDAVFPLARDRLTFPELAANGFEPHKTATLLLVNFNEHNYAVDITDHFDAKFKALRAHASQFGDISDKPWFRDMAVSIGEITGFGLAEAFVRIDIR